MEAGRICQKYFLAENNRGIEEKANRKTVVD
jgi:hypothetical protein